MKSFVEELRWRGMLHDMMPETVAQLEKEMTVGYIGFDPTAPSLHIGNLATIMLLKHFQMAGHKPIALVGGATGMVGDPSGKSAERKLLDEDTIRINQEGVKKQLEKFLDFENGKNAAEIVNNYDWFKEMGFLQFLRDVGKHLTVNYMMAKDSVKSRLETGISFTEFSYQILQAYDFYWLHQHKKCRIQMGGSDQWGNITSGTELIRRMGGENAFALTGKLITKSDGSKFGKSESGNIWLDPNMTSPYKFYQFWINTADHDIQRLMYVFSLKGQEEIDHLVQEHLQNPHLRLLQKALAEELTERVHSGSDLEKAQKASEILFNKDAIDALKSIDIPTLLEVFEGVPQVEIKKSDYQNSENVLDLLSTYGQVFSSKGEARRAIQGNSVSINKNKITDPNQSLDFELLQEQYLLIQNGKKKYHLLKIT